MAIFHIDANGNDMGSYSAETREEALGLYAKDAGYASYAEIQELTGHIDPDWVIVTEIDTDALTIAVEKQLGVSVFQDSYGDGIASVNGQSIASYTELAALIDEHPQSFAA